MVVGQFPFPQGQVQHACAAPDLSPISAAHPEVRLDRLRSSHLRRQHHSRGVRPNGDAGDVEFEPPQTKVTFLTSSIAAMIAGDSSLQLEIMYEVRDEVHERVDAEPSNCMLALFLVTEAHRQSFSPQLTELAN
jgi:hypothetical protein